MATPNEIDGWSASGRLITGVSSAALDRGSSQGVKLQAKLKNAYSLTVQFNMDNDGLFIPNCRALISSSVAGQSVQRIVSVMDGASITVRGKLISVVARDFTYVGVNSNTPYNVQILATLGERAAWSQPPLLYPLTGALNAASGPFTPITGLIQLLAADTFTWPVPQNAGVTGVLITAAANSGVTIPNGLLRAEQRNAAAAALSTYDVRDYEWVPLVPNTTSITFINNSATVVNVSAIFGIDG